MVNLSKRVRKHGQLIAFCCLALFGGIAIDQSAHSTAKQSAGVIYQSQLASCIRGNALRVEINSRVDTFNIEKSIVISFLTQAETARLANYKETHQPSDLEAAHGYAHLSKEMQSLSYGKSEIVDCGTAIKKP